MHAQWATSIVQFLRPELYVYVLLNLLYYKTIYKYPHIPTNVQVSSKLQCETAIFVTVFRFAVASVDLPEMLID